MKKVLKIIGIIVATLVVILVVAYYAALKPRPLAPPKTVSDISELESYLDDLAGYNADSPPGLSLVVVKDGKTVYQKGFGLADGPRDIKATAKTVYNQWSMTKIYTAVAILQLQEQGLLNLDDPANDHLPFFKVKYPSKDSEIITIRHLLTHSSGLPDNVPAIIGWIHYDGDEEVNQTELIKEKLPDYANLSYEPGSKSKYTNVGYMVLAAIIEAASGQTYEQYITEHTLKPLKMDQTGFTYTDSMIKNEAAGAHPSIDLQMLMLPLLVDDMGPLVREKNDGISWFNHIYSDQNGPTGLIGPPTDTARFLMAYLNEGKLDGERILSKEMVDKMTEESRIVPEGTAGFRISYDGMLQGIGWSYVKPKGDSFFLQHRGGGPGFGTDMRVYPDRNLGMVVMGNGMYFDKDGVLDLVASLNWDIQ